MHGTITFGPYRLDPDGPQLVNGDEPVRLQPRPLAVLRYLAERRGTVVRRDELIAQLWAGTAVTKAVLKVAVRAIREALDDDADAPRYIETVGRDGYRLIAEGAAEEGQTTVARPAVSAPLVGRGEHLEALRAAFERSLAGTRQVVFVSGEAGIGKTTLIDRFLADVERRGAAWIARGQCLDQYGEGEAYLPVLEAIGSLAHGAGVHVLPDVLRRHAPTWLAQLPPHDASAAPRAEEGEASAAMPARMLREMADALDVVTRQQPLVLVLEDLQWSDPSTVDLIGYIARRRQAGRLMVLGSLRPAQATFHDHPLLVAKQELLAGELCSEISLELLSLADVTEYVGARFAGADPERMEDLAGRIHLRTEGNALFMVNVANDLVAGGALVWRDGGWSIGGSIEEATSRIPVGLQELLEHRLHGLAPAVRRTLEAASVAGHEFTIAAVAAALHEDADAVEDVCETLASQRVLVAEAGITEWPDGSLTGRYRFLHALYREVLYDGIAQSRRVRLHRAIGLREEAGYGASVSEHAAQLAMHFACGHDWARAVKYHQRAGAAALERHASHEAGTHFEAALDALAHLPDGPRRAERELALVVAHATLLMATRGYAAPETERGFARARALCDASPSTTALCPVLRGLVSYHHVRAELADAHQLGEQLLRDAERHPEDRVLFVQAHYGHGATLFHMGAFAAARQHFDAALREYDPATHREHVTDFGGYDPGVACSLWLAWTLAILGHLEEAAVRNREGLAIAARLTDPFSLAWAHHAAGTTHQIFGDWAPAEGASAEAMRLAEEHGFPHVLGMATINRGWALLMSGQGAVGIPMLRAGVAAVDATGALLVRPSYLGMLAAADVREEKRELAAARLDEALAEIERTGERLHESGLLIAKSRLLSAFDPSSAGTTAAEECLRRALDVARRQGARLFELRAAVALARHHRKHERPREAYDVLAEAFAGVAALSPAAPEVVDVGRLLAELEVQAQARANAERGATSSRRPRAAPSP